MCAPDFCCNSSITRCPGEARKDPDAVAGADPRKAIVFCFTCILFLSGFFFKCCLDCFGERRLVGSHRIFEFIVHSSRLFASCLQESPSLSKSILQAVGAFSARCLSLTVVELARAEGTSGHALQMAEGRKSFVLVGVLNLGIDRLNRL